MAEIARKDKVYAEAMADMQAGTTARLESAINKFSAIQSWKDSDKHLAACQKRLKAIREKARIEQEKAQKKSKRKAWIIRVIIILVVLLPFIIGALLLLIPIIIPIIGGILYGILIFVGSIVSIIFSLFESM